MECGWSGRWQLYSREDRSSLCKKVGKSQERREILEEEENKITIKWRAAAEGGKFDWRLISRSAAQGPLFHRRRPTPAARLVGGETRKKQVEEEEDRKTPPAT